MNENHLIIAIVVLALWCWRLSWRCNRLEVTLRDKVMLLAEGIEEDRTRIWLLEQKVRSDASKI